MDTVKEVNAPEIPNNVIIDSATIPYQKKAVVLEYYVNC